MEPSGNRAHCRWVADRAASMETMTRREHPVLRAVRQHFANPAQRVSLFVGQSKKLESMTQSLAVAHHGPQLKRLHGERESKLHRHHFARFQRAGQSSTDPILSEFIGPSPKRNCSPLAKHLYRQANIRRVARELPCFVPG